MSQRRHQYSIKMTSVNNQNFLPVAAWLVRLAGERLTDRGGDSSALPAGSSVPIGQAHSGWGGVEAWLERSDWRSVKGEPLLRLWHLSWSPTKIPAVLLSGSRPSVPQSTLSPSVRPLSLSPPCPLDPTCSRVTRGRSRESQSPILEHHLPTPLPPPTPPILNSNHRKPTEAAAEGSGTTESPTPTVKGLRLGQTVTHPSP